jgi:hypothetical protein
MITGANAGDQRFYEKALGVSSSNRVFQEIGISMN